MFKVDKLVVEYGVDYNDDSKSLFVIFGKYKYKKPKTCSWIAEVYVCVVNCIREYN